ncbi:MAG TPA: FecR domain-containing protein, partial [Puia sp.]|nr:FecR domain-containing protein [Puia sp.]
VINDSFIAYCFQSNEADVRYWEDYLRTYPGEGRTIDHARDMVLNLSILLQENGENAGLERSGEYQLITNLYEKEHLQTIDADRRPHRARIGGNWLKMAAAAVFLAAVILPLVIKRATNTENLPGKEAPVQEMMVLTSQKGEKKIFYLPDSSKVILNAGSSLEVSKGFGEDNRTVSLEGEAYFDIKRHTRHPFRVRALGYDVTVLGTVFNIKAYAGEKTTELDLISGKVQVSEVGGAGKWMIKPLQKLVLPNNERTEAGGSVHPVVKDLMPRRSDSIITETAWQQNRLEIVNETFGSMKNRLERWFNVKIVFADDQVREYPFTGYFSDESIQQVLKAFQYSYPFNYKIENDIVTIWK